MTNSYIRDFTIVFDNIPYKEEGVVITGLDYLMQIHDILENNYKDKLMRLARQLANDLITISTLFDRLWEYSTYFTLPPKLFKVNDYLITDVSFYLIIIRTIFDELKNISNCLAEYKGGKKEGNTSNFVKLTHSKINKNGSLFLFFSKINEVRNKLVHEYLSNNIPFFFESYKKESNIICISVKNEFNTDILLQFLENNPKEQAIKSGKYYFLPLIVIYAQLYISLLKSIDGIIKVICSEIMQYDESRKVKWCIIGPSTRILKDVVLYLKDPLSFYEET